MGQSYHQHTPPPQAASIPGMWQMPETRRKIKMCMPGNPLLRHTVPTRRHARAQTGVHIHDPQRNQSHPQPTNQHKANHGKFTIEVARLELLSTETHVKLADLLRSSGLGTNQKGSEYQYLQALQNVARLEKLAFLRAIPSLLHNLKIDQAATHLGLGSLYRD